MAQTKSSVSQSHAADALIPAIDFSALISQNSDLRSKAIHDLLKVCKEWGFFFLVNHGISDAQIHLIFAIVKEFFGLSEDDKKEYRQDISAMKSGREDFIYTSTHSSIVWRDSFILRLREDQCSQFPHKPQSFRKVVTEYGEVITGMGKKLVEAVSDALELDKHYVDRVLKLDSSSPIMAANLYTPCPQADRTIGVPPHTDIGLFSFIVQKGFVGLQVEKNGQWFHADPPHPNSILVNVADQLQIFSNGRCKSVVHRAAVNSEKERLSIVVGFGPPLEATVGPAAALVEKDGRAFYKVTKYADYMETKYVEHPQHCR